MLGVIAFSPWTFARCAATPSPQARRNQPDFPKADLQGCTVDQDDAAPRSKVGGAQEAAAAKLRTVFALRNLIGPKLTLGSSFGFCGCNPLSGRSPQTRKHYLIALTGLGRSSRIQFQKNGCSHLFSQRTQMLTCSQTEHSTRAIHTLHEMERTDDKRCCSTGRSDNRQSRKSRKCLVAL